MGDRWEIARLVELPGDADWPLRNLIRGGLIVGGAGRLPPEFAAVALGIDVGEVGERGGAPGDAGRYGEIWGEMGRYGEMRGRRAWWSTWR